MISATNLKKIGDSRKLRRTEDLPFNVAKIETEAVDGCVVVLVSMDLLCFFSCINDLFLDYEEYYSNQLNIIF